MALLLIALAYLAGSIPTGVLLGRIAGVDVRAEGSGNIGATNVARTAGRKLGILTLVGDALKGFVPVLVARAVGLTPPGIAAVGVAALCGHVFSIFLAFRGGKGVATGVGVLLALAPGAVPIALAVFVASMALSRIVSLSSILASLIAPLAIALLDYPVPFVWAAVVIAAIIVARHHENISRLMAGTEQRFAPKR